MRQRARIGGSREKGGEQMSVGYRTRKLLLASTALAAGVGLASYAIGAPPPTGPRAGGVLAVYDTVDAHVAAAKRIAGQDVNYKGAVGLCEPRGAGGAAPLANNTAEPMKIFDNLYFGGIPSVS